MALLLVLFLCSFVEANHNAAVDMNAAAAVDTGGLTLSETYNGCSFAYKQKTINGFWYCAAGATCDESGVSCDDFCLPETTIGPIWTYIQTYTESYYRVNLDAAPFSYTGTTNPYTVFETTQRACLLGCQQRNLCTCDECLECQVPWSAEGWQTKDNGQQQNNGYGDQCETLAPGGSCTQTCSDGYAGDSRDFFCSTDSWLRSTTNVSMDCSASSCGSLTVANSNQSGINDGSTGDTLEVECLEGYSGGGTALCTGDSGADTSTWSSVICALPCLEDEYVSSNVCVSCEEGFSNVAGDLPSGADTECIADQTASATIVQASFSLMAFYILM